jgi:hypothetical protein
MESTYVKNPDLIFRYVSLNPKAANIPLVFIRPADSGLEYVKYLKNIPDLRCISLTEPGLENRNGNSHRMDIEGQINEIDSILEKEKVSEFYMLGYSCSGCIAAYYAVKNSFRVKGLILAECPPGHPVFSSEWALLVKKKIPAINQDLVNGLVKDLARYYLLEDLRKSELKVMLLKSDSIDSHISFESAEMIRSKLKNCELKVIRSFSRDVFNEKPGEITGLIKDFIRQD